MDEKASRRAALIASMALLFFGALTAIALVAWFQTSAVLWNWKSLLAAVSVLAAVTISALVWRSPSRVHAIFGIVVMLASLARIGPPGEWTWVSFALVAVTFVLLMPLVHAAIVLRG